MERKNKEFLFLFEYYDLDYGKVVRNAKSIWAWGWWIALRRAEKIGLTFTDCTVYVRHGGQWKDIQIWLDQLDERSKHEIS